MSAQPPADAQAMYEVDALVDAERSGQPCLEFTDGTGRRRVLAFGPATQMVGVGRRSSSDLVLDWDDQVSRSHARFERAGDAWHLVDDGMSSNGTFVNEQRLHGRVALEPGDVLQFGATRVTFHAPRQPAAAPPAPVPAAPPAPARQPAPVPAPAPAPSGIELSSTQRRVLRALCRPLAESNGSATPATDEQIAEALILSVPEVRTHLRVLYAKLSIGDPAHPHARTRLAQRAFAEGLVPERRP